MAGEGERLRKAREEKGIVYQEVEEVIKIRCRYLEALENEDYQLIPGEAYTRGFLRSYAKYLEIDPEEIIQLYQTSAPKNDAPLQPPLAPIQNTPVWFKPMVILLMSVLAVGIVLGITYLTKINEPKNADYIPTPLPTTPPIQEPVQPTEMVTPEAPSQTTEPQTPPAPIVYEGIVAELTFIEDCWLKVRVDGVLVQDGMNVAGTNQKFEGDNKIEFLTIGNAGGVQLRLNGKDVSPIGSSKQAIFNYVVTEESLKQLP